MSEEKKSPAKKKNNPEPTEKEQDERTSAEARRHEELLKHKALEQKEVTQVLNLVQKYAKPVVTVVIVVCAVFLVDRYLKTSKANKRIEAENALARASSITDYQRILDDYDSTPSAPLAMMGLAMEKFNAGQYNEAEELYGEFVKKYGSHEMEEQAELNQIICREAKGQLGDAHTLYGKFVAEHRDSYLAPVALMGQARCLENLSMFAEAKQAYEDLITSYPGSSWAQLAEANMTVVASKLK